MIPALIVENSTVFGKISKIEKEESGTELQILLFLDS